MTIDSLNIIRQHYETGSLAFDQLVAHSRLVADKAMKIAKANPEKRPDLALVYEGAMLHDLGIYLTRAPDIGCHGEHPYILHGVLGRQILDGMGLNPHAMICERHLVAGISLQEIEENDLPLPKRDMLPETIEEQIVCLADKFYSKKPDTGIQEKSVEQVRMELTRYGSGQVERFNRMVSDLKLSG